MLSACSSVFKNILDRNPHNTSIYLTGIQHHEIESILQFIYLGEAMFYQERMNDFLNVAKDLDLKEIGGNIDVDEGNQESNQEEDEEIIDDEEVTERFWRYAEIEASYRFYINKRNRLKIGLSTQQRLDVGDERFGYRQITPSVEWLMKKKNWNLKWKTSYTRRDFTDLIIDRDEELTLQYQYLRSAIEIEYKWKKNWTIVANFGMVKRWSNNPDTTRQSYREYLNGIGKIGIVFEF